MKNKILLNIAAFLIWLVVCGLGLIIIALGRELLLVLLVTSLRLSRYQLPLWVNLYYVIAGLGWLALFLYMETTLTKAVKKNTLFPGAWFSIGISLLVISLLGAASILGGSLSKSVLQIGLTVLEMLIGVGLIVLARCKKQKPPVFPS